MESWRSVWQKGFALVLTTNGLEALREALTSDDPRLIQGATTSPPPHMIGMTKHGRHGRNSVSFCEMWNKLRLSGHEDEYRFIVLGVSVARDPQTMKALGWQRRLPATTPIKRPTTLEATCQQAILHPQSSN